MQTIKGVPIWGTPDPGALKQILKCSETADKCALMADNHQGYAVPIGGVVAYRDAISPSGVGYDIGCGNKAVLTDAPAAEVRANIDRIMDDVWNTISFGVGRKNNETVDHKLFDYPLWYDEPYKRLKQMAREQLGTVGSGNHYVDIFEDEQGRIWVGCHFGSRGLGHKTATYFLKKAGAKDAIDAPPCVLSMREWIGHDYSIGMKLAGEYAQAGRDWVCDRVVKILGANALYSVHNHHNFAWYEKHGDESFWVVRKGATPAFPGQKGFVGSNMCDLSVILEGVEHANGADALYSTIHGAGRVMSRRKAKESIDPQEWQNQIKAANVCLRGAGLDEAPGAYKNLQSVLAAHSDSIQVLHYLKPLGVAMAGAGEFDPYKD